MDEHASPLFGVGTSDPARRDGLDSDTSEVIDGHPMEFSARTRRVIGVVVVGLTDVCAAMWWWSISVPGGPHPFVALPLLLVFMAAFIGAVVELAKWLGRVRSGRRRPAPLAVLGIFTLLALVCSSRRAGTCRRG